MYFDDDVDTTSVKNFLAQEGVEIIEVQTHQSVTCYAAVTTEASENKSAVSTSSNPSKKCKLSAWLKEAAVVKTLSTLFNTRIEN